MKDFLLIYHGGDPKWMEVSPEEMQAHMAEWGQWFKELEASGNLRNPGAALEPGGAVLTGSEGSISTDTTMSEVKELIGGFSIIQAGSVEEASELARSGPFLKANPNGHVLVRPVLASPEV